ncbi:CG14212 [Drosophila busckii]|uniref:CG14212 n=2 Tax=Drosophila busckii TaxID=30019 RepID=A0A0M4F958_DROBS|nr:CG14212 [Drosophila busckii]
MQQVLETLHQQHGIGAAKIAQQVREVPAVPGILGLLRRLAAQRAHIDMHIVSDANSFFIEHWLEAHQLTNIFAGVHTNPASVDCNELLQIMPYEQQTHCDLCPPNLCKGGVMANLMAAVHVPYKRIIYVGDSCNDLCAIVALRPGDIACIRCGEELHAKLPAHEHQLRCELLHWRDGDDLEQQLFDDCLRNL